MAQTFSLKKRSGYPRLVSTECSDYNIVSFPDSFSCAIGRGVVNLNGRVRGGVRRERRSLVNLAYLCQENLGVHAH